MSEPYPSQPIPVAVELDPHQLTHIADMGHTLATLAQDPYATPEQRSSDITLSAQRYVAAAYRIHGEAPSPQTASELFVVGAIASGALPPQLTEHSMRAVRESGIMEPADMDVFDRTVQGFQRADYSGAAPDEVTNMKRTMLNATLASGKESQALRVAMLSLGVGATAGETYNHSIRAQLHDSITRSA